MKRLITVLIGLLFGAPLWAANPTSIQALTDLGIPNKIVKVPVQWNEKRRAGLEFDNYYLKIELGQLTKAQFDLLNQRYRNASRVPYDSAKSYELVDFMPAPVQALDRKQFSPYYIPFQWPTQQQILDAIQVSGVPEYAAEIQILLRFSGEGTPLYAATNCWGTTLAMQRALNLGVTEFEVGWMSRTNLGARFANPANFSEVNSSANQFGDFLLARAYDKEAGETYVQHAATVIEREIVFEKADEYADDVFRFSYAADVERKLRLIFPDNLTLSYYRLKPGGKLPSMAEADTALASGLDTVWVPPMKKGDLSHIIVGDDVSDHGKLETYPYETQSLSLVWDAKSGRYVIDSKHPLAGKFREAQALSCSAKLN